jgi:hypothetical protein
LRRLRATLCLPIPSTIRANRQIHSIPQCSLKKGISYLPQQSLVPFGIEKVGKHPIYLLITGA